MLSYYAREFSFTEVNSSYYRLPNRFMFAHMVNKTPEDFLFAVKAYRSITHERGGEAAGDSLKFNEALQPLLQSGKMGPVLLQFPYSFPCRAENREYLVRVRDWFEGLELVVEFRHQSWVCPETWDFLSSLKMGFTCVDEPHIKGLVTPEVKCTHNVAYVRFHGRNAGKWWHHREAWERYDYLYSADELRSWLPGINKLVREAGVVFLVFNNHPKGKAVRNARLLRELLEGTGTNPAATPG